MTITDSRFIVVVCAITSIRCVAGTDPDGNIAAAGGSAGVANGGHAGGETPWTGGIGGEASGGQAGGDQFAGGAGGMVPGAGSGGAAGGSVAAPNSACPDRVICDDFENTPVGQAPARPWTVRATAHRASVTVDDAHAWSGTRSVKVTADATTATDFNRQAVLSIDGALVVPLAKMVYGRFMYYTDRVPSVHWSFVAADGPIAKTAGMTAGTVASYKFGGASGLMANYYRTLMPVAADCTQTKNTTFPTKKWTCVAFQFDGSKHEMRYWQDGVEFPELHVVGLDKTDASCTDRGFDGRWIAPDMFRNVMVGWEGYHHDAAGTHNAWLDDVVLDDQPIPCP